MGILSGTTLDSEGFRVKNRKSRVSPADRYMMNSIDSDIVQVHEIRNPFLKPDRHATNASVDLGGVSSRATLLYVAGYVRYLHSVMK